MNEKIGSLLTFCEPLPSRISSGIVRTCANTCLGGKQEASITIEVRVSSRSFSTSFDVLRPESIEAEFYYDLFEERSASPPHT